MATLVPPKSESSAEEQGSLCGFCPVFIRFVVQRRAEEGKSKATLQHCCCVFGQLETGLGPFPPTDIKGRGDDRSKDFYLNTRSKYSGVEC